MVEEIKKTTAKKAPAKKVAEKAETTKTTAAKKTTTTKTTATKKAPAKKVEEVVAEVKVEKAPVKKAAAKKVSKGNKVAARTNRLHEKYKSVIVPLLMEKYGYKSVMEVPSLNKIIINIGVGEATQNSKLLDDAVKELEAIAGQKPVVTKAKKSIATFKLREGQAIGCKVTLRGIRMYEFFDKLVSIQLPRVRDFRGVSKSAFDGRGNYTLGIKEQVMFTEIDYDKITKFRGMDIVIVTTAKTDEEAFTLLQEAGMPFVR